MKILNYDNFFSEVRVAFVGDIMQHAKQLEFEKNREFSYEGVFDQVKPLFEGCDLVVGNLETVLMGEHLHGFKKFSAPLQLAEVLKQVGFDVLVTCNNHSLDQGEEGVEKSFETVNAAGIVPIGTMGVSYATFPLKGLKFTLHAFTGKMNDDKRSSKVSFWGDPIKMQPGINVAYVHAGKEYSTKFTQQQQDIRDELKNRGFDGVIFSHSHVVGEVTLAKDFFDAHGMGNFLSDQIKLKEDKGLVLIVTFSNGIVKSIEKRFTESYTDEKGKTVIKPI